MATVSITVLRHLRGLASAGREQQLSDGALLERFTASREQTAFAALVERHGPLVWGVCRRVLGNIHDAEDAFQATFLTLARRAASIRARESLGGWLYRVAYRTALRARTRAATRKVHEQQAGKAAEADPLEEVTGRELLAVLDEELQRLPERFRTPLVLCYLREKTGDEAARELGWPLRTLQRRLEEGRNRLRERLAQRGLTLPAVLLTASLMDGRTRAAVPAPLVRATVQAATSPGAAAALGAPGMRMVMVVLVVSVLVAVAVWPAPRSAQKAPAAPPVQAKAEEREQIVITGQVLGEDDKPMAGARLAVVATGNGPAASRDVSGIGFRVFGQTTADAQGKFRLTVSRSSLGEVLLMARKDGYGVSQQPLNSEVARHKVTVRLAREQVVRGRLFDLQGEPAAGVRLIVGHVGKRATGAFFSVHPDGLAAWPSPVTTDVKGRFTLQGVARGQEVELLVRDDRFAWQMLRYIAEPGGTEVARTLSPGRRLEGRVLYDDTGKPAAGTVVVMMPPAISSIADKDGRFSLNLPPADEMNLRTYPADDAPYLGTYKSLRWPRGVVRHEIELRVPRGVLLRGKVVEAGSGRPVAGAGVQLWPRGDNRFVRPEVLAGYRRTVLSGTDGTFRMAVPPGPGHLLVRGPGWDFIHQEIGSRVIEQGKPGGFRYYADGVVALDLSPKEVPGDVTVTLRRGVTVRGRLLGPNGEPVKEAVMTGPLVLSPEPATHLPQVDVHGGLFTLRGCEPGKTYPAYFLDPENRWGATVTVSGKQARTPRTVRLAPCGQATVRFLDHDGKPLRGFAVPRYLLMMVITAGPTYEEAYRKGVLACDEQYACNIDRLNHRKDQKTDDQGRFTFPALIPGATYRLSVPEENGFVVKKEFRGEAGKKLDLGDVTLSRIR